MDYCIDRVKMLLHYEVIPVLVFDGAALPMKALTHNERRAKREDALKKAKELLQQGNKRAAEEWFQRAVPVTAEMAREVIKQCRKMNVEYIVAPYEADAQLAWMSKLGQIDCVLTEDSDLVVYGASNILYKMTRDGYGDLYIAEKLPSLDEPPMYNISPDMFMWMCVCAGCDFFPGVRNLGVKRAYILVKKYRTLGRLLNSIRADQRYPVNKTFFTDFYRACLVFRHQTIFDTVNGKASHLSEFGPANIAILPTGIVFKRSNGEHDLDFLGRQHSVALMQNIAKGLIHPQTLKDYSTPLDVIERPVHRHVPTARTSSVVPKASLRRSHSRGFQVLPASSSSNIVRKGLSLSSKLMRGPISFDPRSLAHRVNLTPRPKTTRSPVLASTIWDKFKRPKSDADVDNQLKRALELTPDTRHVKKSKLESPATVPRVGARTAKSLSVKRSRTPQTDGKSRRRISHLLPKHEMKVNRFSNRFEVTPQKKTGRLSRARGSNDIDSGCTTPERAKPSPTDKDDVEMIAVDDDDCEEIEDPDDSPSRSSRCFTPNKRLLLPSATLASTATSRPLVREVARSASKSIHVLEKFRRTAQGRTVINKDFDREGKKATHP